MQATTSSVAARHARHSMAAKSHGLEVDCASTRKHFSICDTRAARSRSDGILESNNDERAWVG